MVVLIDDSAEIQLYDYKRKYRVVKDKVHVFSQRVSLQRTPIEGMIVIAFCRRCLLQVPFSFAMANFERPGFDFIW